TREVPMPVSWTGEQVLARAPDAAAAKSGAELAQARKWLRLGRSERAAWGECQGSAATPYQTTVDLSDGVCHCTCPSRKHPCKHSLGLFLLAASRPEDLAPMAEPGWAGEWLAQRPQKASVQREAVAEPRDEAEV